MASAGENRDRRANGIAAGLGAPALALFGAYIVLASKK